MSIWLLEFAKQVEGGGYDWLSTIQFSIFLIAAFSVFAYLYPFFRWATIPAKSIWWAGVELYATLVTAVLVSRLILFSLFTHFYGWLNIYSLLGLLIFLAVLTAYSFFSITQRRLGGVKNLYVFLLALGLVLILPLSWLSIHLLPSPIAPVFKNVLGAFQMGYPFFWLVIVFGLIGWLSIHRLAIVPIVEMNTEILDDGI